MKVLLVSTVYPPALGGPSLQTQEIAAALTRHGHSATVLTTSDAAEPSSEFEVIHLPQRRARFDRASRNLRLLRDINSVLRRVRPDLVHMQTCEGNVPLAVGVAARVRGIPRLIKFSADFVWVRLNRDRHQGLDYEELHRSSLRARLLTRAQRATFAQYSLVWATAPFLSRCLTGVYGLRPEVVHSLPNLIQLAQPPTAPPKPPARPAPSRPLTALIVARLVPQKGIEVAIDALAQLSDRPIRLRLAGGGSAEYEAALRSRIVARGVEDRVDFLGPVPAQRLTAEYAAADWLLLPSWYEGFPIVLVQAMAAGLPWLATRVGGIPSMLADGEAGLLVSPGDAEALASAMRRLENAELRQQLGERGRSEAQRFNLEAHFDDLLAMYRRAIATND
jgi:glycosyltransferase involved in cell wall biosynthesis